MKAKLLIVSLSLIIATACSKEKFGTKPVLTFDNVNGNSFVSKQQLSLKLRLTDKEGDFDIDTNGYITQKLFFYRISAVCAPKPEDTIPLFYDIPAFPTNKFLDTHLDINFIYDSGDGPYKPISRCGPQTDSFYFRFWIADAAGHVSDTVNTPYIRLIK